MTDRGKLYLIPTTLGNNEPLEVLPYAVKQVIERNNHFIVENEKSARRFIKRLVPKKLQENLNIYVLDKYTNEIDIQNYLNVCDEGINIGLLSEAGVPAIADPGAIIVTLAHQKNIRVQPLVGPSSILMAMMASGLNGQNFAFNGYLPIGDKEKKQTIKQLERLSKEKKQSQIFIETPYRNNKLLIELLRTLTPNTKLCIATDITLETEYIKTHEIKDWKNIKIDLHKRPTIFIVQKY
ncbi:MAG: SAM-dependent methyltransferase [Flavobacteriaceae bacterium]|nr:SAM-dependent methyltransferase [Flavobacteriaceae bacterium]